MASQEAKAMKPLQCILKNENNYINIAYNPGTDDCNKSIAEAKGWTVETIEAEENN